MYPNEANAAGRLENDFTGIFAQVFVNPTLQFPDGINGQ